MIHFLPPFLLSILFFCSCSSGNSTRTLIFEDDFSTEMDPDTWRVEIEDEPNSSVYINDGKLVLDTSAGVTVWLDQLLEAPLEVTYQRTVVMGNGLNDRLSDLNQFWMAKDPDSDSLFTRSGAFAEYDSLRMYYAGIGGNYNSTTRFRKYQGNGEKPLLYDLGDEDYLLQPNHEYTIRIRVEEGIVNYWLNGTLYFQYEDPEPLTEGYFGFRSTWSRHEIDNLEIYQLE